MVVVSILVMGASCDRVCPEASQGDFTTAACFGTDEKDVAAADGRRGKEYGRERCIQATPRPPFLLKANVSFLPSLREEEKKEDASAASFAHFFPLLHLVHSKYRRTRERRRRGGRGSGLAAEKEEEEEETPAVKEEEKSVTLDLSLAPCKYKKRCGFQQHLASFCEITLVLHPTDFYGVQLFIGQKLLNILPGVHKE